MRRAGTCAREMLDAMGTIRDACGCVACRDAHVLANIDMHCLQKSAAGGRVDVAPLVVEFIKVRELTVQLVSPHISKVRDTHMDMHMHMHMHSMEGRLGAGVWRSGWHISMSLTPYALFPCAHNRKTSKR